MEEGTCVPHLSGDVQVPAVCGLGEEGVQRGDRRDRRDALKETEGRAEGQEERSSLRDVCAGLPVPSPAGGGGQSVSCCQCLCDRMRLIYPRPHSCQPPGGTRHAWTTPPTPTHPPSSLPSSTSDGALLPSVSRTPAPPQGRRFRLRATKPVRPSGREGVLTWLHMPSVGEERERWCWGAGCLSSDRSRRSSVEADFLESRMDWARCRALLSFVDTPRFCCGSGMGGCCCWTWTWTGTWTWSGSPLEACFGLDHSSTAAWGLSWSPGGGSKEGLRKQTRRRC